MTGIAGQGLKTAATWLANRAELAGGLCRPLHS